jgi:hypothetical protein
MKKITQLFAIALLTGAISQPLFADETAANANQTSTTNATSQATDPNTTSNNTKSSSSKPATKTKVISMSSVIQQVQKTGSIVKGADYDKDNNTYKIEAIDKHGEKQDLEVNGTKGLSAEQKKTPHEIGMAQALKKLEKNGAYVKSVAIDSNAYKATVVDNQGNSKDYKVDMQTGNVSE